MEQPIVARGAMLAGLVLALGCGDSPGTTDPGPVVASVVVSSPIDTVFAVGKSAPLVAAATTAAGDPVAAQVTWSSSNESVVTVSPAGLAQAVGVGSAVISAVMSGKSGQLRVRVVDADLAGIQALVDDPLRAHLMGGMSGDARTLIQTALASAGSAAASGHVLALRDACLAVAKAADDAADPTDRALLAVLRLFADHAIRLLKL